PLLHDLLPSHHTRPRQTTPLRVQDMPLPPSLGFGFPTATPLGLTSRHAADSQAHSSKGTPSPTQQGALTDCIHMVSGTISLPSRGTFHHSHTVLIHYRSH